MSLSVAVFEPAFFLESDDFSFFPDVSCSAHIRQYNLFEEKKIITEYLQSW
jgi:hypothetical protein